MGHIRVGNKLIDVSESMRKVDVSRQDGRLLSERERMKLDQHMLASGFMRVGRPEKIGARFYALYEQN